MAIKIVDKSNQTRTITVNEIPAGTTFYGTHAVSPSRGEQLWLRVSTGDEAIDEPLCICLSVRLKSGDHLTTKGCHKIIGYRPVEVSLHVEALNRG